MTAAHTRSALAAILCLGLVGSGAELWLLEHYEDKSQLLPLGAIGATLLALAWNWLAPGPGAGGPCSSCCPCCSSSGLMGVVLHVRGNAEFQREMDPSLAGWPLVVEDPAREGAAGPGAGRARATGLARAGLCGPPERGRTEELTGEEAKADGRGPGLGASVSRPRFRPERKWEADSWISTRRPRPSS